MKCIDMYGQQMQGIDGTSEACLKPQNVYRTHEQVQEALAPYRGLISHAPHVRYKEATHSTDCQNSRQEAYAL